MLKLLVDTCIWLDLAQEYKGQPVIAALENLTQNKSIDLIVPEIILDKLARNKERVLTTSQRSLQSHFRQVQEAIKRFGDDENRTELIHALNEVDHKIVSSKEAVHDSVDRIEKLLLSGTKIKASSDVKARVTERAVAKKAPYHREKNSVGDAIIIEIYADIVAASVKDGTVSCAFVTSNYRDFSEPDGDRRKPHSDFQDLFNDPHSAFSLSIVDIVRGINSDILDDCEFDFNYNQESKTLSAILDAEHLLFNQVWYNRHMCLRARVESGEVKITAEENYSRKPYRSDQILDSIWAGALESAQKVENEVGLDNLGPWDDFEWGMINGKLSALCWILGDDWDMLDT